jgi:hypothetical protein
MSLANYLHAVSTIPLPQWAASIISLIAICYGTWLIIHADHDCPKVFAVFSVAGASMYLLMLVAQLMDAVAFTTSQDSVMATGFCQAAPVRTLYDLFMASINLMVLRALHNAHK